MSDALLVCERALPIVQSSCKVCGVAFSYEYAGRGRMRLFCSDPCRDAHWAARDPIYRKEYYVKHGTSRLRVFVRPCAVCLLSFETINGRTLTCGHRCGGKLAARNAKARPSKFASKADRDRYYGYRRRTVTSRQVAEPIVAREIFERDGWRCGLCQKKVDKRLKWPNPRSASIDHIVPIKDGGQHVRLNVQCAHLRCNSSKNAGPGGQHLLFG